MPKEIQIKARVIVQLDGENLLGPGRVRLMEKIQSTGSIAEAAREMGISYRKALRLINCINDQFENDVILTWKGGTDYGGAKLSESGQKLIDQYREMLKRVDLVLEEEASRFSQ
jgi:molybdate transport system regulatory protein